MLKLRLETGFSEISRSYRTRTVTEGLLKPPFLDWIPIPDCAGDTSQLREGNENIEELKKYLSIEPSSENLSEGERQVAQLD